MLLDRAVVTLRTAEKRILQTEEATCKDYVLITRDIEPMLWKTVADLGGLIYRHRDVYYTFPILDYFRGLETFLDADNEV